jgi:hypothetical protein
VKTTGGKGLHVVVPLVPDADWDETFAFTRAFARLLVREEPKRFIDSVPKHARPGKILVDYLRNNRGNTSVAARARLSSDRVGRDRHRPIEASVPHEGRARAGRGSVGALAEGTTAPSPVGALTSESCGDLAQAGRSSRQSRSWRRRGRV